MPNSQDGSKPHPGAPRATGHSERPLRLLIVASLLLPLTIFAVGSWISYGDHFDAAEDRLQRTVGMIQEHAIKVFETFEISERYMEELFNDVSNAEISKDEAEYSGRIRNFIRVPPQLRDLWVIDEAGHPLVAGTLYPVSRTLDLSDRDYFRAHQSAAVDTYVSEVVEARAANTNFFAITRKRLSPGGRFDGIYLVSIAPEYFSRYYASLPRADFSVAGLVRADGAALVRYPVVLPAPPRLSFTSPLMSAIIGQPDAGLLIAASPYDQTQRILAYRKLPNQNVYVYAGLDTAAVRAAWMRDMSVHLIFGVPATLALFALAMRTVRNTRQMSDAYRQLHEETARRQTAEVALRQAQKMEAVGRLTGGIARLQQSAHRHHRQCRIGDAPPRPRRGPREPFARLDPAGLAARRDFGPAAVDLLAPASAGDQNRRHQPAGPGHVGALAPDHRRDGDHRDRAGERPVEDSARSEPARECRPQSGGERARRHARRRPPHHRDVERLSR
jgi:two-component system NtrC family sensor kinase